MDSYSVSTSVHLRHQLVTQISMIIGNHKINVKGLCRMAGLIPIEAFLKGDCKKGLKNLRATLPALKNAIEELHVQSLRIVDKLSVENMSAEDTEKVIAFLKHPAISLPDILNDNQDLQHQLRPFLLSGELPDPITKARLTRHVRAFSVETALC